MLSRSWLRSPRRLLLLRHLARNAPKRPASDALTPTQLVVLHATAKRPLPKRPTVRDAMLAVAGLGGHLPRNGDPGWLVLGRGMQDLLLLEFGWLASRVRGAVGRACHARERASQDRRRS